MREARFESSRSWFSKRQRQHLVVGASKKTLLLRSCRRTRDQAQALLPPPHLPVRIVHRAAGSVSAWNRMDAW